MKWNDKDIKILKNEYGKTPTYKLCSTFSRNRISISRKAMQLNLKGNRSLAKKYEKNLNYFHQLSLENCYWAGFIAADGCIINQNIISIELAIKDFSHLQKFADCVGYTGIIRTNKDKVVVRIYSVKECVDDLNKNFNITPRKTFTLQPPNLVDDNLILAFIIGYIDGDGCINLQKEKYTRLTIMGTYSMIKWIKDNLFRIFNLSCKINIYNNGNIKAICISGKQADFMIERLRKIAVPKMNRKWKKI